MRRVVVCGMLLLLALTLASRDAGACRFWGLIGDRYPADLIPDQLRDGTVSNLERLGGSSTDGWGIGYFISPAVGLSLTQPIVRRGGPRANDPNEREYRLAVEELRLVKPRAAIGHVRAASSGHIGVPDPHPFQHEGILFAHNGTIPEEVLLDLLEVDNPGYLGTHPPDWTQGYIDSELYFLYLLKYANQHPRLSRTEAFRQAVRDLSGRVDVRLNFVMTEGDTMWALRCAPGDIYDPVAYSPWGIGATSSYWTVASQPLGSHGGEWAPIPRRTLAVFVPGVAPRFVSIDAADPAPPPESRATMTFGNAVPNPTRGEVAIPVRTSVDGLTGRVEIWDAQGRSIWRSGMIPFGRGDNSVRWSGRDGSGRAVASGIYFCRITAGPEVHEEPIRVVR